MLAKIAQRRYEVEIIGLCLGDGIWPPLAKDCSIEYRPVKANGKLKHYFQSALLLKEISGKVIYASKPYLQSFGIGLLRKWISGKPLVLDIDDWELGFIERSRRTFLGYSAGVFSEKMTRLANEITVSNSFLQKKFGGTIIWHARDTDTFNPRNFNGELLKMRLNSGDRKIILFLGTPRMHKGIEDLIKAARLINHHDILLIIVGVENDTYSNYLVKLGEKMLGTRFIALGLQPFQTIPEFLAMSDVVVVPQRHSRSTIGQVPAKIFDAMAMAKPIVTTNVSDLSQILDECGWVVNPESPEELARAIEYILTHPEEAIKVGNRARQRCVEEYSYDAMEKVLMKVLAKYE
jgi:glycosyltransferase involved in cell wall biosynthesis